MKVVALLTVRNEQRYLARCLEHLNTQGIEICVIDNSSTDRTLEIAQTFLGRGVMRIEHFPFNGRFEFKKILINAERLAQEIDADWFILQAADEILQAPTPYKTLLEGIEDANHQGYNVINFDEFVFLPTHEHQSFEGLDYVKAMEYYYFFEPEPCRLQRSWKKKPNLQLSSSAGHKLDFPGKKIFPQSFILRHYMVLSKAHAIIKYGSRIYSQAHKVNGWSQERRNFSPEKLNFPTQKRLKRLEKEQYWDKSDPWKKHEFLLGESSVLTPQPHQGFREQLERAPSSLQPAKHLPVAASDYQLIIPSNQPMTVLIIANMHRSGSSFVAALLQQAGLDLGQRLNPGNSSNPKGHFENLNFYEFHQTVLQSQKLHEDGWTTLDLIQVEDQYITEAKAIITRNASDRLWGWKEPRTTLFLDFWHQLLPDAQFLLIYRAPWDVINSLYRRGDKIFQTQPELAIQMWLHYNQKILHFCNQFPNACLLANIQTIIQYEAQYIKMINQKFNTNLKQPQTPIYDPSLFTTLSLDSYQPSFINHYFPEAVELYQKLEAQAWQPHDIPSDSRQSLLELTPQPAKILQDWWKGCHQKQQNQTSQQELEQAQKELAQTQAQMHQIQEQLEQYYFQINGKSSSIQPTPTQSQLQLPEQQYQLLVQQAYANYQNTNLAGMAECLQQSLAHTSLSRIETMVNWVEIFAQFSKEKDSPMNTATLTSSPEWKQLMQQLI